MTWVGVEKRSGFGWHTDMTVPRVRRRPLALAQVPPMKTPADDQRKRVSQWARAPYATNGMGSAHHRLSIAFSADRRIRLLTRRTGVIHVVTAVITAKESLR